MSLRLVPHPLPPRRHPTFTARIAVRAANVPHGRTPPFALSEAALGSLLAAAEELEAAGVGEASQRPALEAVAAPCTVEG